MAMSGEPGPRPASSDPPGSERGVAIGVASGTGRLEETAPPYLEGQPRRRPVQQHRLASFQGSRFCRLDTSFRPCRRICAWRKKNEFRTSRISARAPVAK